MDAHRPGDPRCQVGVGQRHARSWFARGVPLSVVETTLLLACLRRNTRPPDVPPLPRIRSLAYFQPVIEELLENLAPDGYLQDLRFKLRNIIDRADPAVVQKPSFQVIANSEGGAR
jgi:hypothetical protein